MSERKCSVYDNCLIRIKTGEDLAYASRKRCESYLKHGLATLISENPFIIQFTFDLQHEFVPHDSYFLTPKQNICVVCGDVSCLTKTRIIPSSIRNVLSKRYSISHVDIVLTCHKCHDTYNSKCHKKLLELSADFVPYKTLNFKKLQIKRYASGLVRLWHLPSLTAKKEMLLNKLEADLGHRPTLVECKEICNRNEIYDVTGEWAKSRAEIILAKFSDKDMVKMWRLFFLDEMKPLFLPENYDINMDFIVRSRS